MNIFLSILTAIFLFVPILFALVLTHEYGHFLTARYFKITISEFGIGFPPKARILFRRSGVDYTLNWLPIGGFVAFGDDPDDPNCYLNKPAWQRAIVTASGAVVNLLTAVIIFSSLAMAQGHELLTALGLGWQRTWAMLGTMLATFGGLFNGSIAVTDLAGPVGIAAFTTQVTQAAGLAGLCSLAGLLAINLFLVNLLPIPSLDGGRLFFILLELPLRLFGRRISANFEGWVHAVGYAMMLILIAFITINDVGRLFA